MSEGVRVSGNEAQGSQISSASARRRGPSVDQRRPAPVLSRPRPGVPRRSSVPDGEPNSAISSLSKSQTVAN